MKYNYAELKGRHGRPVGSFCENNHKEEISESP